MLSQRGDLPCFDGARPPHPSGTPAKIITTSFIMAMIMLHAGQNNHNSLLIVMMITVLVNIMMIIISGTAAAAKAD